MMNSFNTIIVGKKPVFNYILALGYCIKNFPKGKYYLMSDVEKKDKLNEVWSNFTSVFIPHLDNDATRHNLSEKKAIIEFSTEPIKNKIDYVTEWSNTIDDFELQNSPISDFFFEFIQCDDQIRADTEFALNCQDVAKENPRSSNRAINLNDFWEFFNFFDSQIADNYLMASWGQFHSFLDRKVGREAKRFSIYKKWAQVPYGERDLRKIANEKLLNEIAPQYMGTVACGINTSFANLIGLKKEPREAINFLLTFYAYTKCDKNKQLVEKSYDEFLKIHRENQARYI